MQILSALLSLGNVTLEHVKGHQDDNDDGEPLLSWEAQLNQRCDELATRRPSPLSPFSPPAALSSPSPEPPSPIITRHSSGPWQGYQHTESTSANITTGRQRFLTALIDLAAFHSCTLTVSFLQRLFIIKWVNDLLPFQVQQHKFNQSPPPPVSVILW
jgi:hypothetical protein